MSGIKIQVFKVKVFSLPPLFNTLILFYHLTGSQLDRVLHAWISLDHLYTCSDQLSVLAFQRSSNLQLLAVRVITSIIAYRLHAVLPPSVASSAIEVFRIMSL